MSKRVYAALVIVAVLVFSVGIAILGAAQRNGGSSSSNATRDPTILTSCNHTLAYWAAHPEEYPSRIVIGEQKYSRAQVAGILTSRDPGQALLQQVMVAFLNSGPGDGKAAIDGDLLEAYQFLATHPAGAALLESDRLSILRLSSALENFNEGLAGISSCEGTRTPTPTTTPTVTLTPPDTHTPSVTLSPTPSRTPLPSATATLIPSSTDTVLPSGSPSPTNRIVDTATPEPTGIPSSTSTATLTATPTPGVTVVLPTNTPTLTKRPTRVIPTTVTVGPSKTIEPTNTKSPTRTRTPTITRPTKTLTPPPENPTHTLTPPPTPNNGVLELTPAPALTESPLGQPVQPGVKADWLPGEPIKLRTIFTVYIRVLCPCESFQKGR